MRWSYFDEQRDGGGLKLTATGNRSRAVVEEMFGIIQAPNDDKAELLRFQKVINEPDFLPLHFVRILTQVAKLTGRIAESWCRRRWVGDC